jgi:CheY-like chemotaxis protein
MSAPIPLRQDFDVSQLRSLARRTQDGPQARRLLALRHLTAALFEDEQMDTIECESAEAALATLLIGGREVAMIFADVRLPGAMGGVDLAEVKLRWPLLPMILTSGHPLEHIGELPPGVAYMPKPWKPLNVLLPPSRR